MKLNKGIFKYLLFLLFYVIAGCVNPVVVEEPQESHNSAAESEAAPLDLEPDVDVETVASIMDRDDVFLLDVREQWEYDAGHIAGNTFIPMGSIPSRLTEIPKDQTVIIYCHSGARSLRVTNFLSDQGYTNIHNMLGGITAWEQAGLQVEK